MATKNGFLELEKGTFKDMSWMFIDCLEKTKGKRDFIREYIEEYSNYDNDIDCIIYKTLKYLLDVNENYLYEVSLLSYLKTERPYLKKSEYFKERLGIAYGILYRMFLDIKYENPKYLR